MAIDFKLRDVIHRITAKFFPAYLPEAKKPYVLHAKYQPDLDIHGIASKADVYNITTSPKVIEEGFTAACELIYYLAADGYKIKTPVFTLKVAIPGEYEGSETHLPEGITPQGRLNLAPELRKYLSERVLLQFDGIEENFGIIAEAIDIATGDTNLNITPNALFELRGSGLKIAADDDHTDIVGIYLEGVLTGSSIKFEPKAIAVNESRTLKAIAPDTAYFSPGEQYYVVVRTQAPVTSSGKLLKNVREVKSDFTIIPIFGTSNPESNDQSASDREVDQA
jgi:hypothetical protein